MRYLGVEVDRNLTWKDHVNKVRRNCLSSLAKLRRASPFLSFVTRKLLYNTLVLPHLDYCCAVWMECGVTLCQQIERLQNYGMRITSSPRLTHSADLRKEVSLSICLLCSRVTHFSSCQMPIYTEKLPSTCVLNLTQIRV